MTNTETELAAIRAMLASGQRPADLAGRRQRLDDLGARYEIPADVVVEPVDAGGVKAEWTTTPAADPTRVIMFLHGGGYISGSIKSHRHMIAQAGREAGTRTLALGYRLAPEHPFPAALEDALNGYRFLLSRGFLPENIVIAGESAGGGLTIATLVSLREAGMALPACAWCSSPWADLEMSGDTMQTKAAVDPLIQGPYLHELATAYLNGLNPRMPMVSPIHADLRGLPPLLIQVGSDETLLDDALRLAGVAATANVRTTLQVWPHMIHAWHLFYAQLADGRRALAEVGAFVRANMS
ncbi:alpha/beta hydrolase [Aureimonas fodinaquatilis]|uniref:Alpha/beta hydrolase n=1 Tax=Aureimonas fodinaquatilis TaxID=2565783 RepID=A0A5B0E4B4_9HYPH|nr:alpha/beta hydrolase [Aureimonas fodinaquatilis]KAA0972239.1 alpha/beta hydrolase [Aureimonas fodinaquatilis]